MTQHSQDFPWFPDKTNINPITGLEEIEQTESPSFGAAFNAEFSRQYPLAAGIERMSKGEPFLEEIYPEVEGYEPIKDESIKGYSPMEFVGSKSPEETQQRIAKLERSMKLDQDAQGIGSLAGGVFGAVGNPLLLGAAASTGGMSLLPSVATVMGAEAASEVILKSQMPTRTLAESAINVGLVGALEGVGKLVFGAARPKIAADLNMSPTPLTPAQGDAGAALATEVVDLTGEVSVPRSGMVRALGASFQSPANDVMLNSASNEAKQLLREMVDVNIRVEGKATTSAESVMQEVDGVMFRMTRDFELQYKDYMDRGGKLDDVEFLELVSDASRNGDDFPSIPQVQSVARAYRKILDDYKTKAQNVGLLDKNLAPVKGSRTYFKRAYLKDKIVEGRSAFKSLILKHLGKDERFLVKLKGEDGADDTLAAVLPDEWPALQKEYGDNISLSVGKSLDDVAESIINNVTGNGQVTDFVGLEHAIPKAGSLQERTLGFIPDNELKPYLENNALAVMNLYARQMSRDIVMTRFSSAKMTDEFNIVKKSYADKINNAKPKQAIKLQKRMEKDLTILEAGRDMLLGTYGRPKDATSWLVKAGRWTKILTMLSSGLNIPTSSIPDIIAPSLRHGFKPFYKGFKVLASGQGKEYALAVKYMGIATESVTNSRAMMFADMAFASPKQKMANRWFGKYTGLSYQTDLTQALNGMATSQMFIDWMRVGSKLSKGNKLKMRDMGIDGARAKKIMAQINEYSKTTDGVTMPETHLWKDREAATIFESALRKEVRTTTLVPGMMDAPLWTKTETGRFLFLFQSFITSAHSKFLIAGLQRADADYLVGVLSMTMAGALTTALKDSTRGVDYTDKKLDQMMFDAVDRAGVIAWMAPPVNLGRTFLLDQTPSRYQARRKVSGVLSTATTAYLADVGLSTYGVLAEQNEKDAWRLLRKVPFANSFHFVDLMQTMTDSR